MIRNLNIVLVEPQIPQNTGNISRTCAVTGAKLHLVRPLGFDVTDKNLKRAGLDYWNQLDITYYDNLDDFFVRNSVCDSGFDDCKFFYFTTKGKNTYSSISYPDNCYLIFGREDKGLPESLLWENSDTCLRIPMRPALRSLNLSNAVAVAVYEVLRQWDFPELASEGMLTQYSWDS